jgi:hypothetical protein
MRGCILLSQAPIAWDGISTFFSCPFEGAGCFLNAFEPTVRTIYHAAKILFLGGAASSHPLKYINSRGGADWCGLNLNNDF